MKLKEVESLQIAIKVANEKIISATFPKNEVYYKTTEDMQFLANNKCIVIMNDDNELLRSETGIQHIEYTTKKMRSGRIRHLLKFKKDSNSRINIYLK